MPSYKLCSCGGVIDERARPLRCSKCGVRERMKPKSNKQSGIERGYGSDWDDLSKRYRANHPMCEECLKHDRFTAAREVHHVVPIAVDPSRRLDWSNLMAVCRGCHQKLDKKARQANA